MWFFIDNSPKWDPVCTKLLPVIHNTTPLFAKLKLLWRYIIVSFISTAFVAVKLKFSKFCIPMQHPWNGPSWIFLGPLLPQIWPDFAEIFTRDSVLGDKNSVSIILQTLEFLQNRMDTKFAHLVQPWPSHFPLIMVKIEKNKFYRKTSALRLSKYAKIQTLSFLPFK